MILWLILNYFITHNNHSFYWTHTHSLYNIICTSIMFWLLFFFLKLTTTVFSSPFFFWLPSPFIWISGHPGIFVCCVFKFSLFLVWCRVYSWTCVRLCLAVVLSDVCWYFRYSTVFIDLDWHIHFNSLQI